MEFHGVIQDGKISFTQTVALAFAKFRTSHEGWRFVITDDVEERSTGQLRMYRAWLNSVCQQTGNDPDELHEFLIAKCAPTVVSIIKGRKGSVEIEQKKRTSGGHRLSMDKLEMSEFMERCAALTGYPLPTQEELETMGYIHN